MALLRTNITDMMVIVIIVITITPAHEMPNSSKPRP